MKQRLLFFLLLSSWLGLGTAQAQSQIAQESFETNGEGSRYTSTTFDLRNAPAPGPYPAQYFLRAQPPVTGFNTTFAAAGIDGGWLWASEGARGQNVGDPMNRPPQYVQVNNISIAGKSNIQVKVLFADPRGFSSGATIGQGTNNWENDDFVRVKARINGGSWVVIGQFVGDNAAGATGGKLRQDINFNGISSDNTNDTQAPFVDNFFKDFTFTVSGTGTTMDVMVEVDQLGGTEELAFDNIRVFATTATTAAPVLASANSAGATLSYNEGAPATTIIPDITVSDADSPTLTGGSVSLTTGFVPAQDRLSLPTQSNITGTYNITTGVLTLSGTATLAAYQAALRSVQYQNIETVTAVGGLRVANFSLTDGTTASNTLSRDIVVTAQLNAPAALPYLEDFDSDGEGLRYATDTWATSNPCLGFLRTNQNPYACTPVAFGNISNSYYWYSEGTTNGANPNPVDIGTMTLAPVNASSANNLHFNIRLGTGQSAQWEIDDFAKFYYRVNGGAWVLFAAFYGNGPTTATSGEMQRDTDLNGVADGLILNSTLQNVDLVLPPAVTGASVDFQIIISSDGQEELAFDRINITGTPLVAPTVTTAAATSIASTSAVLGGNVTADGGAAVTDRGVVYSSTNQTPTTSDTKDANAMGTGSFSETITSLAPGTTYYVRAYAINSAGTSYGAIISFTTLPPVSGTTVATNVSCNGGSNGTINLTPRGGVAPYTFLWENGARTEDRTGLSAGSYSVVITDAAGATGTVNNITITQPSALSASTSQSDVTTSGGNNGSATITVGGGTPGYAYSWSPNVSTSATASNLRAGTYSVTATDANGCTIARSFTIAEPTTATVVSVTRLSPSPTATASVSYRVVFSGSVTGLNINNFTVTLTGITGASVSSVSGAGTTYTVTVNTGTGDGTLRLNVANATGISPTITNVPYTAGELYTITKSFAANPQLTIQGTGGTGSDVTAFVDQVQVLSGGSAFANGLQNSSFENHDPLSNGDFGYTPTNASWTFNSRSGIAESGSAFTPTTPIPSGIAVAFIQSTRDGNGQLQNGQLQQGLTVPTGSYQVNFQAAQRICCTTLDQSLNVFINGVFIGSIQPNSNGYTAFTSATFSVAAPALTATVSTTSASPTSTAPIPFSVSFSQSVGTSFSAADVTVTGGTLTSGSFSGSGSGPYTFTVTPSASGTVMVSLAANVATDANNTGNAASNAVSVQYSQPVTAAPVVIAPANGSQVGTTAPTYTGTAPVGSTITVYVDGTSIGTTTATNAGNWTLSQPTALTQGSHTVYATARLSGQAVSANSNTNTFTVDSVRPTVAISSTAGASGSTTTTTPISYTVTFSESVTGFVAGDVTVGNGTLSGFTGAGTSYSFNVTPTTAGATTTVNIAANVAQDAAGNGNTAATQFSLTYQPTRTSWTGAISADWYTAGNWNAGVPAAGIDATVPVTAPNMPTIAAGTAQARNLTLNAGATLRQTGGTLVLSANLTNNGTYQPTGGTVALGMSTLANILGSSNTRFWDLTIGASGAQSSTSASTSVQRLLTLNGNFATNGNPVTLESNAASTAMVINNGTSAIGGNVTVQRYIMPDLNPNLGYRHVAAPISSATVASLTTSSFSPVVNPAYNTSATPTQERPFPTVYSYDQSRLATTSNNLGAFDKGWYSPAALSDALTVGQGYTVNISAGQTWNFFGAANNGTVSQTLSRNIGATADDAGLQLVGNPYPSPLNWDQVASTDRPGVDGVIYVWASNDPSNPYAGNYAFYQNGFGNVSPVLPLGQAFFVRVTRGQASGTLNLNNSHRPTSYTNPTYHRPTAETRPAVQLTLHGAGSVVTDDAFVYFEDGATAGFDKQYDAEKLANPSGLNLSTSLSATQRLSVDGRGLLGTAQQVVPLAVGVPTAGSYSLSAAQLLNLDATPVYLRDVQLGTLTDLRRTPSYQFTVTNAAALITGRFELVFSPQQVLATVPAALVQQVALYPNPAKKAAFIELPARLGHQAVAAALVDALGRQVQTSTLPAQGALAHQLDLSNLATGVYSLHLSTSAGVVVKRLVIE